MTTPPTRAPLHPLVERIRAALAEQSRLHRLAAAPDRSPNRAPAMLAARVNALIEAGHVTLTGQDHRDLLTVIAHHPPESDGKGFDHPAVIVVRHELARLSEMERATDALDHEVAYQRGLSDGAVRVAMVTLSGRDLRTLTAVIRSMDLVDRNGS